MLSLLFLHRPISSHSASFASPSAETEFARLMTQPPRPAKGAVAGASLTFGRADEKADGKRRFDNLARPHRDRRRRRTTNLDPLESPLSLLGDRRGQRRGPSASRAMTPPNTIRVAPAAVGGQVTADGQDLGTFADVSSVYVDGGDNNDQLTVAANLARPITLSGGNGDDTLLALSPATLTGGDGTDAFWAGQKTSVSVTDASTTEAKRGINRLPAIFSAAPVVSPAQHGPGARPPKIPRSPATRSPPPISRTPRLSSPPLAPPPLTGAPRATFNDCYLLAALGSVANTDSSLIYQTITSLGDGTYVVRIMHGKTAGKSTTTSTPTSPSLMATRPRTPAWARTTSSGSPWSRRPSPSTGAAATPSSTPAAGWATCTNRWASPPRPSQPPPSPKSPRPLALPASRVTVSTKPHQSADSSLVPNHAYTVESIQLDAKGHLLSLTIKNPWGLIGTSVGDELTLDASDAKGPLRLRARHRIVGGLPPLPEGEVGVLAG